MTFRDTFNVLFHETYRENGPHGSTGCAKGFQSAGHVSILNAIADAVGVRVATLPVTPEKLKAAMTAKARPASPTARGLGISAVRFTSGLLF